MASINLYPPTLETITPAFIVDNGSSSSSGNGTCDIYFSLSKLTNIPITDIVSMHIAVMRQDTGKSVIYKSDDNEYKRYRRAGILIYNFKNNIKDIYDTSTGLYKFKIVSGDIRDNGDLQSTIGWAQSGIYKVQIRLSVLKYGPSAGIQQSNWLNVFASNFSEWSAFTIIKSIPKPVITCKFLSDNESHNYDITTLEYNGSYTNDDLDETLYSYRFDLYKDNVIIEQTEELYTNQNTDKNKIYYLFKTELKNNEEYILKLHYTTKNLYKETKVYKYKVIGQLGETPQFKATTIENNSDLQSSLVQEEEDGRICIKLLPDNENVKFKGEIILKRASDKDNFTSWEDILTLTYNNETLISSIDYIYDYTAESGVWYKYAIQTVTENNVRSNLRYDNDIYVLRDYEFTYLLGDNNQQLKLSFNNNINDFKFNYADSVVKTIGSKYPFINRIGKTCFRQFPLSGLISFHMDENNLFISEEDIYKYNNIVELHNQRRINKGKVFVDTIYERDFREKVLEFLQNGKPKLFKSPTEGNMIIRINDVSLSTEKALNRMIMSFSATAYEVADSTIDNYKKYNFISE